MATNKIRTFKNYIMVSRSGDWWCWMCPPIHDKSEDMETRPVADPGFPIRSRQFHRWGPQPIILALFSGNCTKLKKMDRRGCFLSAPPPRHPPGKTIFLSLILWFTGNLQNLVEKYSFLTLYNATNNEWFVKNSCNETLIWTISHSAWAKSAPFNSHWSQPWESVIDTVIKSQVGSFIDTILLT